MIELVPLCTAELSIGERFDAGSGPSGHWVITEIASACFAGRIAGTHAGGSSADWVTITPDGLWLPDVRLAIHTHDNALVLMRYTGRLHPESGKPAIPLVSATFQTGDERYQWLTELQAIGRGERTPDGAKINYDFYELR